MSDDVVYVELKDSPTASMDDVVAGLSEVVKSGRYTVYAERVGDADNAQ